VIVCDDGLQLLSEAERARRVKYYRDHNVAYVARPPDGVNGDSRKPVISTIATPSPSGWKISWMKCVNGPRTRLRPQWNSGLKSTSGTCTMRPLQSLGRAEREDLGRR
jgi:hypothetical protein